MKRVRSSLIASIPFLVALSGCATPTEPTASQLTISPVTSFATAFETYQGTAPPDVSGIWRGTYRLTNCSALSYRTCMAIVPAARRTDVRLQVSQIGTALTGSIEFENQSAPFVGVVTRAGGIAGGASDLVSARLHPSASRLAGYFVVDRFENGALTMSKYYEVVVPLTR